MNLHELVSELIVDTKGASLKAFGPEIALCATVVAILLLRIVPWGRPLKSVWIAVLGAVVALTLLAPWRLASDPATFRQTPVFTGMLVFDGFSVFMRGLLIGFLLLFIGLTRLSGVVDDEDEPDVFVLLLGATLGFCLMVAANHLLMVFLAVEMASVPCYVLAGMMRSDRAGSEAALKYSVYGAGAAGIMLYGISLLAGLVNAVHLPTVARQLAVLLPSMTAGQMAVLTLAVLMVMVGLAFKLSAVPFHFWCPDVFEGATAEIGGFLSVASKAAALALLVRVVLGLGTIPPSSGPQPTLAMGPTKGTQNVSDRSERVSARPTSLRAVESGVQEVEVEVADTHKLQPVRSFLGHLVAVLAVITCTFGNLAAYGQRNIKRLLAYSTIAHAGYMMMAIPALLALAGLDQARARHAVSALGVYLFAYLFMNLGAFAVVALVRVRLHSEEIDDYAGLLRRAPAVALCLSVMLLGLVGIPPLSGFLGKWVVFASLVDGFSRTGQSCLMALVVIGGLNSVISLFYYLRIIRVMTMRPEPETRAPFSMPLLSMPMMYLVFLTLPTATLIFFWDSLNLFVDAATRHLLVS